jgi:hypothetical protein
MATARPCKFPADETAGYSSGWVESLDWPKRHQFKWLSARAFSCSSSSCVNLFIEASSEIDYTEGKSKSKENFQKKKAHLL